MSRSRPARASSTGCTRSRPASSCRRPRWRRPASHWPRQATRSPTRSRWGVFAGLLAGRFVGVLGGAWIAVRAGLGTLPGQLRWGDVVPVAVLAGIGYTVSLLIVRLSLTEGDAEQRTALAVLAASVLASLLALALLRVRARARRADAEA